MADKDRAGSLHTPKAYEPRRQGSKCQGNSKKETGTPLQVG